MGNTLSAHMVVLYFTEPFTRHAVFPTLIKMANALSAYNTHVVFYRAFHLSCSVIYINKHG